MATNKSAFGPMLSAVIASMLGASAPAATESLSPQQRQQQAETGEQVRLTAVIHFDFQGQARVVDLRNVSGNLPQGFKETLQQRLLAVKVPPPTLNEQPVDWRTGALISLGIERQADGGGQLTIKQLRFVPLAVFTGMLDLPRAVSSANNFDHRFEVVCEIDAEGHCDASVEAPVPMPEPVRKWALDSAKRWQFEPQQLAGQAQPGKVRVPMWLQQPFGEEAHRPIDFRVIEPFYRMRSSRE
ncbi:hypothetical protein [Pelomonas sp. SE-A7]|uniref:hypothetical protein n=1 Tax=Pelomonas sp. SE-A7 TaxID=3054953 RepID=UPI00259CBEE6|nr:hypothetical protein [Pelomonas sp. SE-A7]MDM4765176.1 hypothetical protein [Pelomonas sp. SE-A7]